MKFRVWDRVNKCFSRISCYIDSAGELWKDIDPYGVDMSGKRSIRMSDQYVLAGVSSGMKSRRGEDIYENDILDLSDGLAIVKYNSDMAMFEVIFKDGGSIDLFEASGWGRDPVSVVSDMYRIADTSWSTIGKKA